MKPLGWLLVLESLMAGSLVLLFLKEPVFPGTSSADFAQHLQVASDIAKGHIPAFSNLVLYGDIWFYLAGWLLAFPMVPLETVRYAMGVVVGLSPLVVYLAVGEVLDARAAIWSAALWTLSGFVWFGMVFNSGLWPNFWGVLSSLLLVAAVVHLAKNYNVKSGVLLLLALANALFSHHTTPLVVPPILAYLVLTIVKGNRTKTHLYLTLVLLAVTIGSLTYLTTTGYDLIGHLFSPTGQIPQLQGLASYVPIPTLAYMVAEISATPLGDLAAVAVLVLGAYFVRRTWTLRSPEMLVFSVWFLMVLLAPVYTAAAWRAALFALAPLTVMAGWSLSRLKPETSRKVRVQGGPYAARTLLFVFLLATPTFGSWGNFSFFYSTTDAGQPAAQQQADLQAIQWMAAHLPHNDSGTIVAVNDFNFRFLPYMGGSNAFYAPGLGVIFNDPFQLQLFALHAGKYLVVSMNGTASATCDPRYSWGLLMTVDRTEVAVGGTIVFLLKSSLPINATGYIVEDGLLAARVNFVKGQDILNATFTRPGPHTFTLNFQTAATTPLTINVTQNTSNSVPRTASVPYDFCQPWTSFNPATVAAFKVIYQNPMVRVYEAK